VEPLRSAIGDLEEHCGPSPYRYAKMHHLWAAGGDGQAPRDGDKHHPNTSSTPSPLFQL